MLCSTCEFFLFKIIFQLLFLDENTLLLKLRTLTDMSNSVPARECINRNAEQVLILDSQCSPTDENVLKNHLHAVSCIHIISSYTVVSFAIRFIFFLVYLARCYMQSR
jgi:hypothetical protein